MLLRRTLVVLFVALGDGFCVVRTPPPRRRPVLRAEAEPEAESSKWMADYLVRVHEARLEAVARAREEARQEALGRIADLETQLAALRGVKPKVVDTAPVILDESQVDAAVDAVEAVEAAVVDAVNPVVEAAVVEAFKPVVEAVAPVVVEAAAAPSSKNHPHYDIRNKDLQVLSSRWGPEEIERVTLGDARFADVAQDEPPTPKMDLAYEKRVANKEALSSRWGDEELQRIAAT
mmetsp:Transcript_1409/g.4809  ORF Transcript_1409/g.4809 Transcript_1409/m.4809 type:complete len:234 (+) Transcript_1409:1243-1944(+)